jgi:hypothetical protein
VTEDSHEGLPAVFGQLELPFQDLEPLDAMRRVELWLASQPQGHSDDADVIAARLYLADGASRAQRARRWQRIREVHERATYEDGGVGVHGGPETVFLLDEAASALVEGLWLASLLCSHAACERHLAGLLSLDESALPRSWRAWGLGRLLVEARERDVLPAELVEPLEALNEVRKVSAHFKPPLHEGSLLRRAEDVKSDDFLQAASELSRADAFAAYETARSLMYLTTFA